MFDLQFFLGTIIEDWLTMFVNTINFFGWWGESFKNLLVFYFVVLPPQLLTAVSQLVLRELPPVVRVCNDNGCELTDVGKSVPVILAMLGLVWWLKRQGKTR